MPPDPHGRPVDPPASGGGARRKLLILIAACAVLLLAAGAGIRYLRSGADRGSLPGYESRVEVAHRQYQEFYGKLMSDPGAEGLFEEAAREVAGRRYQAAIELLREAAKSAPLPIIFDNLGTLLAKTDDRAQAAASFREALARNVDDILAQSSLARLGVAAEVARPVTVEVEPNGSSNNANLIPLGKDVSAEMAGDSGDTDCFRFIAPPAPRDRVVIEVESRTPTLELGMRLYDGESRLVLDRRPESPGRNLVEYLTPAPNSSWTLEFWSAHSTGGEYTVRVSALRAFDAYEPNDNIFAATRIEAGSPVQANIMDETDTDYYSFESQTGGTVTIELENRSSMLIPALTTFGADKRNTGFGPDVRTAGGSLRHTMAVEAHRTYYLQVWGQARSSGEYTLTVR
jgi:tetratricopeptide (TPR) repeat protein